MDIKSLMKQAQQMQYKMKKMQDDFSSKEFSGFAGGGLVKVLINGAGVAKKLLSTLVWLLLMKKRCSKI